MHVPRQQVRPSADGRREQAEQEDWFERALPDIVDTGKNSSLLASLDIVPDALQSADRIPQNA